MRILLFGATGGTGRALLAESLRQGHRVTAFVRNPLAIERAPNHDPDLDIVVGDVFDETVVDRAVRHQDVVFSALGGRPWRAERICSRAIRNIVPAMGRHGIRRIVAISTFGAGDSRPQVGLLPRIFLFGGLLRTEVADKEAMERALAASDLDWTVVRVGLLSDGPATGRWRAADDGSIRGMSRIARADVATFMLAQLESDQWNRRRPVVVSADISSK